ncbi:hypothetical protein FRZ67_12635 [Panacibacter ginsenosidivorans]|uniref:Carboxypeptidase-like regulatory domain-containing protein n=1 Tax=Panacibacter ginsenosidivorans TaxID=1813871 RepID=A0A5B8VAF5_9BACT|nr:hypothetical protein [Panacibacter ginsenosidivorans]QEC68105.1 hypothetical protein FRZ67_12635 [Panacibacter ginsenosidivorans]
MYDYFSKKPLDAVTVMTSSGLHTISDSLGKFTVTVSSKDSVWFSFLSKNTLKYPVDTIRDLSNFEIALYVDAKWLPAVKVRNKNYTQDSIQNREDYAKVFNFRKPTVRLNSASPNNYTPGAVTVGLDINEFINMFRFRRNRQILSMQERLEEQEREKYVNHRYTKYLVGKLTGLKFNALDSFIEISKPSYELLITMNEIELGYYIQKIFAIYQNNGRIEDAILKKEDN